MEVGGAGEVGGFEFLVGFYSLFFFFFRDRVECLERGSL